MELETVLAARPSRRSDLGAWYAQLLDASERGGISMPDLARRLGCSQETVYSWRRRLTKERRAGSRRSGLVRVAVAEPDVVLEVERLEVRTRSGHSILVPARFEPASLAAVVAALERC